MATKPKRTASTGRLKPLLGKVQTLRRQVPALAEEDVWRSFLATNAGGVTSTRAMSEQQLVAVVEALHRAGAPRKASTKAGGRPRFVETPQVAKIRALWITLADAGVIRNRTEQAMGTFVKNQTGQELGRLAPRAANAVIEALKAMANRAGVTVT